MPRTTKLFSNGRSQTVRLPAEFRFDGSEVYVRRDPATGDVILSRRPESWADFFELMQTVHVPEDFMADREDAPPQKRAAQALAAEATLVTHDRVFGRVKGLRIKDLSN